MTPGYGARLEDPEKTKLWGEPAEPEPASMRRALAPREQALFDRLDVPTGLSGSRGALILHGFSIRF